MAEYRGWTDNKKHRIEFERALDEKLATGDSDDISAAITPQSLGKCNTNILLKAFEVSGYLRCQVHRERPDVEELVKLAHSVDEFTTCLIDPLKSDSQAREAFGDSLDLIVDKAIEHKQMKFLSHPVVYNLLEKRWRGRFAALKSNHLKWALIRLWCLLDLFIFPFLFVILFIVHSFKNWRRKYKELDICFILNSTKETGSHEFQLMKTCTAYIIRKCGYRHANYCVISGNTGDTTQQATFETFNENRTLAVSGISLPDRSASFTTRLHDDVHEAVEAFGSLASRKTSKKVLFVFHNATTGSYVPAQKGKLRYETEILKSMGVKIVPVAVGSSSNLEHLKPLPGDLIRCGGHADSSKLGKKLLREIDGMDLYELYLDYFTTPYFIFARDTLSYLALLGLHIALCISYSTVRFIVMEWAILVFFMGRLFLEVNQYSDNAIARRQSNASWPKRPGKYKYYQMDNLNVEVPSPIKMAAAKEKKLVLGVLGKYFSDRWNVLDFVTLLIYFVTFALRMVTWAVYSSVSGNRAVVITGYLYGLNTMILTLRVFGSLLEASQGTGTTHIALVSIIEDVAVIFVQFLVGILSSSLAITKVMLSSRSFTGEHSQENGPCKEDGFSCWFEIVQHLAWTLLGITELEPFTRGDTISDYVSQILYAAFIIAAMILLVNMMVAILSNTYQRVQNNSLKEWSFKKAISVTTYSNYHPIPVPWNLLSQSAIMLCRRCQSCSWRTGSRKTYQLMSDLETCNDGDSDFEMIARHKEEALDQTVEKLMASYFALYGCSFPLTEEHKLDNILSETQRNREMCNQIARKVFSHEPTAPEDPPVGPNAWKSAGIQIDGCLLTYVGKELCKSCKIIPRDFHGARYIEPFSKNFPNLEVLIQEDGKKREINVGVVRAKHDPHKAAGETSGTIGYFAQDGRVVSFSGMVEEIEGLMAYRGDIIRCQVNFEKMENDTVPVVFTLNGKIFAEVPIEYGKGKRDLFPFIRMGHEGIRVLAKMCAADADSRAKLQRGDSTEVELPRDAPEKPAFKGWPDVQLQELLQKIETMYSIIETQSQKVDHVTSILSDINQVLQGMKTESTRATSSIE